MNNIDFINPEYLFLLFIVPLIILWDFRKKIPLINRFKDKTAISLSTTLPIVKTTTTKQKLLLIPKIIRYLAIILLIIAIARPVSSVSYENNLTDAVDIIIAMDVSTSMLAQDFKPNRLEAAKSEANRFLLQRQKDRLGLIVFGGEAYTQCPLTTDHDIVSNLISKIESGLLADGTAIGVGLATAINRLKKSVAKSKVVILLTDGVNNTGSIDPYTVAKIARDLKIKVYSIGVGTRGTAPYPFKDNFGRVVLQNLPVEIDEKLLEYISSETNGKYFRATDNNKLKSIYKEIDKLEKTEIQVKEYKNTTDQFFIFAYISATFLILEKILYFTYFRTLN